MKRFSHILSGAVMVLSLSSCFKEDEPVPPYKSPDGVVTAMAETKPDYSMQVYYDLETNTFVSSNHREDWDFSYSCETGISAVYLNSAKRVRVFDTQSESWTVPVTLSAVEWEYDESTGEPEKTALHDRQVGHVYVLDLGFDMSGGNIGFKKFKFVSVTEETLTLEYAEMDGSNIRTLALSKNADYNFVYYSFKNGGGQVFPEPMKNRYDLLFTYYTTKVYYANDPTQFEWYAVNGTLLNPNGVAVAVDSSDKFTTITYQDLAGYTYSEKRDAIGYDWKTYDIDAGVYTILVKNTYLIRDRSGNFWKLRFTSFTNQSGERGYPTFEVGKF